MKLKALLILAFFHLSSACALAEETFSQSYTIDNVRFIEAGNAIRVELHQGEQASVTAEASRDVLERVTVDVRGERLVLGVKSERRGFFGLFDGGSDDDVLFKVQLPQPSGLALAGASRANVGDLEVDTFSLDTSGASNVQFARFLVDSLELKLSGASHTRIEKLKGKQLQARISGASKLTVADQSHVDKLDLNVSGAGKYHGAKLTAEDANVDASGAANANVAANALLDITASGGASVSYSGEPRVKQKVSGGANVHSRDR